MSSPRASRSSSRSWRGRIGRPGRSSRWTANGGSAGKPPGSSPPRSAPSSTRVPGGRRGPPGAARLPALTRAALGDAAILGRSFSLRDLRAIRARIGDAEIGSDLPARDGGDDLTLGADRLADDLEPAVTAGLLLPQDVGGAADFTFTHEQV